MFNISNMETSSSGKRLKTQEKNGSFVFDGGEIKLLPDGKIMIYADKSAPEFVTIRFQRPFSDKACVYGDTWERGYGDLCHKAVKECTFMPWYFIAHENEKNYCFGVKTGCNALCHWTFDEKYVCLSLDIRCGSEAVKLCGRELCAAQLVISTFDGDFFNAGVAFCKEMCDLPKLPKTPIYGGNDWYCNYGNNSHENILRNAEFISDCAGDSQHRPLMVIDDGWQTAWTPSFNGGPWRECNEKFGDMKKTADGIKDVGAIPGIWVRPLLTSERLSDFPYRDFVGTDRVFIDPSHPAAIEYIKNELGAVRAWGYELVKFDFLMHDIFGQYGFDMGTSLFERPVPFYDKTKTTAEIIKHLYSSIRDAVGEDCLLMGCNTASHLAAGVVDIQRTGDDTSGREWSRTLKMGVNTLAWRMHQHKTFYTHDADCVGITKDVPWDKNAMWLDLLAQSGTPLFVSCAEDCRNDTVKKAISEAFTTARNRAFESSYLEPVAWELIPSKWKRDGVVFEYNWM